MSKPHQQKWTEIEFSSLLFVRFWQSARNGSTTFLCEFLLVSLLCNQADRTLENRCSALSPPHHAVMWHVRTSKEINLIVELGSFAGRGKSTAKKFSFSLNEVKIMTSKQRFRGLCRLNSYGKLSFSASFPAEWTFLIRFSYNSSFHALAPAPMIYWAVDESARRGFQVPWICFSRNLLPSRNKRSNQKCTRNLNPIFENCSKNFKHFVPHCTANISIKYFPTYLPANELWRT